MKRDAQIMALILAVIALAIGATAAMVVPWPFQCVIIGAKADRC
jgi:hypothetical protein